MVWWWVKVGSSDALVTRWLEACWCLVAAMVGEIAPVVCDWS